MKLFSVKDGLLVQEENLRSWKRILKKKVFKILKKECKYRNRKLQSSDDGFKVFRGSALDDFLHTMYK